MSSRGAYSSFFTTYIFSLVFIAIGTSLAVGSIAHFLLGNPLHIGNLPIKGQRYCLGSLKNSPQKRGPPNTPTATATRRGRGRPACAHTAGAHRMTPDVADASYAALARRR